MDTIGAAAFLAALYLSLCLVTEPFPLGYYSLHMGLHLFAYLRPRLAIHHLTRRDKALRIKLAIIDIYFVSYTAMYFSRILCQLRLGLVPCWYCARTKTAFIPIDNPLATGSRRAYSILGFELSTEHPILQLLHTFVTSSAYVSFRRSVSSAPSTSKRQQRTQDALGAAYFVSWLLTGLAELGQ